MPKPSSPTSTEASQSPPAGEARSPIVAATEPRPAGKPRRTYTVEQKRAILAEADRCTERGDVGALLRKHAIYSSTLTKWRNALAAGELRRPGRPTKLDEKDKQLAELRRRVTQLEARAKRAESLVDFQKKALSLLDAARALGENS
jgi:transposase-like protein